MSKPPKAIVLQQGGSTTEWYAATYDTVEEADKAVHGHEEATYTAFRLDIPTRLGKALAAVKGAEGEFISLIEEIAVKAVEEA